VKINVGIFEENPATSLGAMLIRFLLESELRRFIPLSNLSINCEAAAAAVSLA